MSAQPPLRLAGGSDDDRTADPPINIDRLSERDLVDLNRRIVERLRVLNQLRAHTHMLQFRVGQRVRFRADARVVEGVLTRYNRKTVTILTDDGQHWNVSPSLLQRST